MLAETLSWATTSLYRASTSDSLPSKAPYLPFQFRQFSANEPDDAGVMHLGDDMPGGIVDGIERRHHLATLKGQARFW